MTNRQLTTPNFYKLINKLYLRLLSCLFTHNRYSGRYIAINQENQQKKLFLYILKLTIDEICTP